MTFGQWVVELFKDERGMISIKPVVAFMGAVFLCGTMLWNSFSTQDIAPADSLTNAVMVIVAIGLGADSLDKFSLKSKKSDDENTSE